MNYANGKWIVQQEIEFQELNHKIQILIHKNNNLSVQLEEIQEIKADLKKIKKTLEEINQKFCDSSEKKKHNFVLIFLITFVFLGGFSFYFLHKPPDKVKKGVTKKAEIIKVINCDLLS